MTADPTLLGSKFAPYGKDGCKPPVNDQDQSDNSMMSSTGRRYRVNRVNSSDCYYDGGSRAESRGGHHGGRLKESKRARSRSTDHLPNQVQQHTELNSMSIRKMLRPVHTAPESPVTSPENTRGHKQGGGKKAGGGRGRGLEKSNSGGCMSEPEFFEANSGGGGRGGPSKARSEQRISVVSNGGYPVASPPSDEVDIFDSHCFATTPSSSNNSEVGDEPASPTSQLLLEYEEHLRNTLEKDSESYSLHTFEALLSRSMENLEQELHNLGADFNPKTSFLKKRGTHFSHYPLVSVLQSITFSAAATSSAGKEKSWTLGNVQRKKGGSREKQMPMRPRSVNSTFEKSQRGASKQLGYATLNPNNRSFPDNTSGSGNGSIYGR